MKTQKQDKKENKRNKKDPAKQKLAVRIVCAAVTFLVLIFSIITLGWFTNSTSDKTDALEMKSANNGFDLAAAGTDGLFDSYLDADAGDMLSGVMTEDSSQINLVSTNGKSEIKWAMNDQSNMKNHSGLSAETSGIQPGSCGTLSFYVIPQQDGALNITFSLETILYSNEITNAVDDSERAECIITEEKNKNVTDLVKGHILFFGKCDNGVYSERISDNRLTYNNDSAKANIAYRVDIYWIWPNVFDQLILPSADRYLTDKGFERIIADGDDTFYTDMGSKPEKYFADADQMTDVSAILDKIKVGSENALFDEDVYKNLNSRWNDADQIIGTSVSYIELKLATN